eukprot:scaffold122218_cov69-Phaeocystis_antarctica.AAC.1
MGDECIALSGELVVTSERLLTTTESGDGRDEVVMTTESGDVHEVCNDAPEHAACHQSPEE